MFNEVNVAATSFRSKKLDLQGLKQRWSSAEGGVSKRADMFRSSAAATTDDLGAGLQ